MRAPAAIPGLVLLVLLHAPAAFAADAADAAEAPAASSDPPAEALLLALPFHPDAPPERVMLDLAPPGQASFVMMLDTGAAESVLTPGMAHTLGVTIRPNRSSPYRRATALGRDLQFWVDTRFSDTASRNGFEYGLLGCDFLDDYVLEIDTLARQVRFLDPKRYAVPERVSAADERVVRWRGGDTRPLVPVTVGEHEIHAILDTGSPPAFILSGQALRKLGADPDGLPEVGVAATTVGPMTLHAWQAQQLAALGFEYGPLTVLVAPRGWYNVGSASDSAVGLEALAGSVLRIDFPRRRVWMRRPAPAPAERAQ